MKIIASEYMPDSAKLALKNLGEVLFIEKQVFLYDSIASHPDIFFFQTENHLVTAQNIPKKWENWLIENSIEFSKGKAIVQGKYPNTAHYNAVATAELFIHNLKVSDPTIAELTIELIQIHVNQAYTRCNLIVLDNDHFITSDRGIEKKLRTLQKHVLFIQPDQILLESQKYGFIGGCCGLIDDKLFMCGSLNYLKESKRLIEFAASLSIKIVELYDGPLVDVGSIIFIH